jgi:predicted ArsR family transcriptional regulator
MKLRKRDFDDLIDTLEERGDIEQTKAVREGAGRRGASYRLRRKDAPSAVKELGPKGKELVTQGVESAL